MEVFWRGVRFVTHTHAPFAKLSGSQQFSIIENFLYFLNELCDPLAIFFI